MLRALTKTRLSFFHTNPKVRRRRTLPRSAVLSLNRPT
jgi:hypothetical protein